MISIFSFENTAKLFLIAGCCQKNVAIAPKKTYPNQEAPNPLCSYAYGGMSGGCSVGPVTSPVVQ